MGLLEFLEPEESVGLRWHRLIGDAASYPHHPDAAVRLDDIQRVLAVFYRGLGGDPGIQLAPLKAGASSHRLSLRQRLGMDSETLDRPSLDDERLLLPQLIDTFADPTTNRDLYFWLAAFFVALKSSSPASDAMQQDILFLRDSYRASQRVLRRYPGLRPVAQRLAEAVLAVRPARRLPKAEAAIEAAVVHLLQDLNGCKLDFEAADRSACDPIWAAIIDPDADLGAFVAPRKYRSFLPVPMWGEVSETVLAVRAADDEDDAELGEESADQEDERRHKARRADQDEADRDGSFILNRFEKILSLAEMVNVNRSVEDDDEEEAKKAADELDELTISKNQKRAAAKLRIDLDLPPDAVDATALTGPVTYPEWDYRSGQYHRDHCVVYHQVASEEGEGWVPTPEQTRRVRRVRRQFEALRPKREIFRGRPDGSELDLEALVRARCDFAASGQTSNRVYLEARNAQRDLAVALLVDVSLSTDSWVANQRVLDMEKEALTVLSGGLAACGDDHAIFTFTSRRRDFVRIETVKDFDEAPGAQVERRIAALKPGYYTRIGAALRHTTALINKRPNRHRLILVLTDGKPNDVDHYEGRYGIEDTRRAVREARQTGAAVFGVTIDSKAQDYFPHIFGPGAFHIVDDAPRLITALPKIFRQLVT